jgi:hypothetical protein
VAASVEPRGCLQRRPKGLARCDPLAARNPRHNATLAISTARCVASIFRELVCSYSMISAARTSTAGEMIIPSSLAVVRLTTISLRTANSYLLVTKRGITTRSDARDPRRASVDL